MDQFNQKMSESEAMSFLAGLSKDLKTNREQEKMQADPIYYGITCSKCIPAAPGDEDRVEVVDERTGTTMTLDEFFDTLTQNRKAALAEECMYDTGVVEETDGYYIEDYDDFAEYLSEFRRDYGVSEVRYIQLVRTIAEDAMFLTRKDANDYLENRRHGLGDNPRSYAMTAQNNPKYKKLLDLLQVIDWEKSHIVLCGGNR